MLTRELITLIKREASSWSRDLIRSLINEVQFIMMCKQLGDTRVIDPLTGDDPILTVTTGQYQYVANSTVITTFPASTEAWYVSSVYTGTYGGDDFVEAPIVTTEGTSSSAAVITFMEDQVTGQEYKVKCYKKPIEITSEDIQLTVPPRFHLTHVYEGVMGRIESTENGGTSNRWSTFLTSSLQSFWGEMNKKATQKPQTRYRNF